MPRRSRSQIEFEALHHDENGRKLPERGEPTQPQNRVQTDIALRVAKIGGGDIGHGAMLAPWRGDHKLRRFARQRLHSCPQ